MKEITPVILGLIIVNTVVRGAAIMFSSALLSQHSTVISPISFESSFLLGVAIGLFNMKVEVKT